MKCIVYKHASCYSFLTLTQSFTSSDWKWVILAMPLDKTLVKRGPTVKQRSMKDEKIFFGVLCYRGMGFVAVYNNIIQMEFKSNMFGRGYMPSGQT